MLKTGLMPFVWLGVNPERNVAIDFEESGHSVNPEQLNVKKHHPRTEDKWPPSYGV